MEDWVNIISCGGTAETNRETNRWNDRVASPWIPPRLLDKSTEIFHYRWPSFVSSDSSLPSKGTSLQAGRYEWPFQLAINGSLAESIEGLAHSYISYSLKATITRGRLGSALHAYKPALSSALYAYTPVRIVRVLTLAALDLAGPIAVEGTWPGKVEYQIRIPQRAISFGTAVTLKMSFTPLQNLRIGIVRCVLFETQEFTAPGDSAEKSFKRQRTVSVCNLEIHDKGHHQDIGSGNVQGVCLLQAALHLPKRFSECVQDTNVWGIKIRHRVRVSLDIHNPDGHISEVIFPLPAVNQC